MIIIAIENNIMIRKIDGTQRRSRPCTRWIDDVKKAGRMKFRQLKEEVKDWELWGKVIMDVTRNHTWIDRT